MSAATAFRNEYLKNNKFLFYLKNPTTGQSTSYSFASVTNLSQTIEYDSIAVGGYNEGPYFFPKQKSKADTLTLEKGVRRDTHQPDTSLLCVGAVVQEGLILVMEGANPIKGYAFNAGLITRISSADLSAKSADILIQTLEITHTGLQEVSV